MLATHSQIYIFKNLSQRRTVEREREIEREREEEVEEEEDAKVKK